MARPVFAPRIFSKNYWIQTFALVRANLAIRYRSSVAGLLWVVAYPIALYTLQYAIFSRILRPEIPDYRLYLLTGLIPWMLFTSCFEMCIGLFQFSGSQFRTVPVHPIALLSAQIIENAVGLLVCFCVLLLPLLIQKPELEFRLPLLLPAFAVLLLGVFGCAWCLAIVQVFFRDTRYMISFGMGLLYLATPVFYAESSIAPGLKPLLSINPIYLLTRPIRAALYPPLHSEYDVSLAWAFLTMALVLGSASFLWRRRRDAIFLSA